MKNCIVAQSGGPTVAINASLSGVIRGALQSDKIDKIYGGNDSMDTVAKLSVYTREKGQLCEWDTGVYYDVVGIAGLIAIFY